MYILTIIKNIDNDYTKNNVINTKIKIMENITGTATISLEMYEKLKNYEKEFNTGKILNFSTTCYYNNIETFITVSEALDKVKVIHDKLTEECKTLREECKTLRDEKYEVKRMNFWQFRKWRK